MVDRCENSHWDKGLKCIDCVKDLTCIVYISLVAFLSGYLMDEHKISIQKAVHSALPKIVKKEKALDQY